MKNQDKLNKMCPAFGEAGILFGNRLVAIVTLLNEVKADFASLKTQFDGLVTDTNTELGIVSNHIINTNTNKGNVTGLLSNVNTHYGNYDLLKKMLMNQCLSPGGLAMSAGTKDQPKTVNTISFMIDGVLYSKAAADPLGAWTVGHTGLGNSEEDYYLMCVDSGGTLSTVEGAIVAAAAGCVLPAVPAGVCAIGAIKVVTGAGGTFVPDTTLLDDADIVATYEDLAMMNSGAGLAADSTPNVDSGAVFVDTGVASTRACPAVAAEAVKTVD